MSHPYFNYKLTAVSQNLRREMTPEEKKLWYQFLKKCPETVYRQKVIGNYIVDFYIASKKLVIELDGRQHLTPENREYDAKRDAYLSSLGLKILRYPNLSINRDFRLICEDIQKHLGR